MELTDGNFRARVECDSIHLGKRLTTFVIRFPRIILAEVNTHRVLSKGTSSSRAKPFEVMVSEVEKTPFVPSVVYYNQKGMQGTSRLSSEDQDAFEVKYLSIRDMVVAESRNLQSNLNIHKQTVNRLLEPFTWVEQVISGTDWANFFALRTHKDAQPEFRIIARMMWEVYQKSRPVVLDYGEWHRPFVDDLTYYEVHNWLEHTDKRYLARTCENMPAINDPTFIETMNQVSVGRCARVSYKLPNSDRRNVGEDVRLYQDLTSAWPIHATPLEHVATPTLLPFMRSGNFQGWKQLRKTRRNETIKKFTGYDKEAA